MQSLNKRQEEKGEEKGKRKEKEERREGEDYSLELSPLELSQHFENKYSVPCLKISQKLAIARERYADAAIIDLLAYKEVDRKIERTRSRCFSQASRS